MKTNYQVFSCSQCKEIIELEITEKEYIGYCRTCKREIRIKK